MSRVVQIVVPHDLEQRLDGSVERGVHRVALDPSAGDEPRIPEAIEKGGGVQASSGEHLGEALAAFEAEFGGPEPRLRQQRRRHGSLAGHAPVERALPGAFLVTLKGAAGEGAAEPERQVRLVGRQPEQPGGAGRPRDGAVHRWDIEGNGPFPVKVASNTRPITS